MTALLLSLEQFAFRKLNFKIELLDLRKKGLFPTKRLFLNDIMC